MALFVAPVAAGAEEFSQPWKNPERALVVDGYEYNLIDWTQLATDKRIVGFINKASDGLPPPYFCSGDKDVVELCKTKWRRHAVAQELYQTRRTLAKALGLKWGAYHLGRPGNPVEQADNFLTFARPGPDDLMAIDIEDNDPEKWMSLADAEIFVREIKGRTGRWPILYTNGSTAQHIADRREQYPILSRLPLWYARYKPEIGIHFPKGNWDGYALWQFSAQPNCNKKSCPYRVPGTNLDIDVNVAPMDAAALRAAWPFGALLPEREMLIAETEGPSQVPLPIWREAAGEAELVYASVAGMQPTIAERLDRWMKSGWLAAERTVAAVDAAVSARAAPPLPEPLAYAALAAPAGTTPSMNADLDPQMFRDVDPVTTASIAPPEKTDSGFRRADFPTLILETPDGVRENVEDLFRRPRQNSLAAAGHDRPFDQNRMSQHEINQLIIAPARVAKPEIVIGRIAAAQQFAR